MGKIISSTNNKGGVTKTSTIINVSQLLAKKFKKKVLVVDLDEQCNLSQVILGKNEFKENPDVGELFDINSNINIKELIIQKTKNLHIIPGKVQDIFLMETILKNTFDKIGKISLELRGVQNNKEKKIEGLGNIADKLDSLISDEDEWTRILKKRLSEIQDEYDYIFLDLPPSMALVPENSWRASDYLLVPISDNFALNGTEGLVNKMVKIKREYNDNLQFIFFFSKVPLSSNGSGKDFINNGYMKVIEEFRDAIYSNEYLSKISYIMDDYIRESKDVEKSYITGKSLLDFKGSKVLKDYIDFTKSLQEICEE